MTVAELLERISSAELTEWRALFVVRHEEQREAEREAKKQKKGGK